MYSQSAHLYDAIYGAFKDYPAEAARVAVLVHDIHPEARAILDVACGTGEHIRHLRQDHAFDVDGLDLDAGLLDIARRKVPEARFFEGDMADFRLDHRFDVVMCLFSSIGYLRSLDRVTAALRCFRRHLAGGGVIIVEPWFAPGVLREGNSAINRVEVGGMRVERSALTTTEGRLSKTVFDYRTEDASGVQVLQEVHELGLFTPAEMLSSFRDAGLTATHDPVGLTDRGLYVARVGA